MVSELHEALRLERTGSLMEAQAILGRLIQADPGQPDIWHALSRIALKLGQPQAAFDFCGNAFDLDPEHGGIRLDLGLAVRALGRWEDSLTLFRDAARLSPEDASPHRALAETLTLLGRREEALQSWRAAIILDPHDAPSLIAAATLMIEFKAWDEALSQLHWARLLLPQSAAPCILEGNALAALLETEAAAEKYREALALDPGNGAALYNLGNLLLGQDRLEEALEALSAARRAIPGDARIANNLGVAQKELGRLDEAETSFQDSLSLDADFADAHWNLATILFLKGRLEQGFAEAEWRWRMTGFTTPKKERFCPAWTGQDIQGKTVLIHAEQGFGDALQFARYLPLIAARGANIVFECDPRLASLLAQSYPTIRIVTRQDEPDLTPAFHAPLLSLPHFLGVDCPNAPYLKADPARAQHWRKFFAACKGVKAGLVWQGDPGHANDRRRSPGLASLLPLIDIPGVTFVSLQRGHGREDLNRITDRAIDLGGHEADTADGGSFAETASQIVNLDLVITPDTAMAHLAGGLGVPVWTLLPFSPDWRWGMEGETTCWYPSMRLFRQKARGDWAGPVARLASLLKEMSGG
jgi:tetratricopeptide (TPR) repeat protein